MKINDTYDHKFARGRQNPGKASPPGHLWMRGDKRSEVLAFDNIQNRGIRGTTGWQRYYVVLDVPKDATQIAFGILLSGPGLVWLNDPKPEIVNADEASTNMPEQILPESPVNLQFVP